MITDSQRIMRFTCVRLMPDGAQQPELAGAFEDRQAQRVRDAEERDHDREEQHAP